MSIQSILLQLVRDVITFEYFASEFLTKNVNGIASFLKLKGIANAEDLGSKLDDLEARHILD